MIAKAPGFVNGAPRLLLRAEGLAVALASIAGFAWSGASWLLFAALILAPDLSMLGYLAGPRPGAFAYNAVHTYVGPVALLAGAAALGTTTGVVIALIWSAHIGVDRVFGYGLKYGDGFSSTHLGRVGPRAQGDLDRSQISLGESAQAEAQSDDCAAF